MHLPRVTLWSPVVLLLVTVSIPMGLLFIWLQPEYENLNTRSLELLTQERLFAAKSAVMQTIRIWESVVVTGAVKNAACYPIQRDPFNPKGIISVNIFNLTSHQIVQQCSYPQWDPTYTTKPLPTYHFRYLGQLRERPLWGPSSIYYRRGGLVTIAEISNVSYWTSGLDDSVVFLYNTSNYENQLVSDRLPYKSVVLISKFLSVGIAVIADGNSDLLSTGFILTSWSICFAGVTLAILFFHRHSELIRHMSRHCNLIDPERDIELYLYNPSCVSEIFKLQIMYSELVSWTIEIISFVPSAVLSKVPPIRIAEKKNSEQINPIDSPKSDSQPTTYSESSFFEDVRENEHSSEQGSSDMVECSQLGSPAPPRRGSARKLSETLGIADLLEGENKRRCNKRQVKRSNGGIRAKKATILVVDAHILMNNTAILDEHMEIAHVVSEIVLSRIKDYDGVPIVITANNIIVSWNSHDDQPYHALRASHAAIYIRDVFEDMIGNQAMWSMAVTSGTTFAGLSGIPDQRAPVVCGETVSLANDFIRLSERNRCRILCNELVKDACADSFICRIVDVIQGPRDPLSDECIGKANSVYEMVRCCKSGDEGSKKQYTSKHYENGFNCFRNRDFSKCVEHMTLQLVKFPTDYQAFRIARICQLFLSGDILTQVPVSPFLRNDRGWEDYERFACKETFSSVEPVRPPFSPSVNARHASQQDNTTGDTPYNSDLVTENKRIGKIQEAGNKIMAVARRAAENKAEEANRLKQDIIDARKSDLQLQVGSLQQEFVDRKGVKWSRSGKLLGTGAFGEVYKGMSEHGSLVAMKILKLPPKNSVANSKHAHRRRKLAAQQGNVDAAPPSSQEAATEELVNEVELLTKLRHDNIVAYLASQVSGLYIVICMEFLAGGSLITLLEYYGSLPLSCISRYLVDILRGLKFLHDNSIVHRDVKPHNVLLHIDGQAKLSDFGASQQLAKVTGIANVQGTPLYMAPEAARGHAGYASDIWGVGITLAQLIIGTVPYVFTDGKPFMPHRFLFQLGSEEDFAPTITEDIPRCARDIFDSCTLRDPEKRPNTEALLRTALITMYDGNVPGKLVGMRSRSRHSKESKSPMTSMSDLSGSYKDEDQSDSRDRDRGRKRRDRSSVGDPYVLPMSPSSGECKSPLLRRRSSGRFKIYTQEVRSASAAVFTNEDLLFMELTDNLNRSIIMLTEKRIPESQRAEILKKPWEPSKAAIDVMLQTLSHCSSSLPCIVYFLTPLRFICGHMGSSKAVLCRNGAALLLTSSSARGPDGRLRPEATFVDLSPETDSFLIVASLNLWKSLTYEEVIAFVKSRIDTVPSQQIGISLLDICKLETSSCTIVILQLKDPPVKPITPLASLHSASPYAKTSNPVLADKWKQEPGVLVQQSN